jgi:hypothetical protein
VLAELHKKREQAFQKPLPGKQQEAAVDGPRECSGVYNDNSVCLRSYIRNVNKHSGSCCRGSSRRRWQMGQENAAVSRPLGGGGEGPKP